MYFSATVSGHSHLWRQRYPDGKPQQITFGPTEEVGVAAAPDGRSLVTSLGLQRESIWIHDAGGERPVTSDAIASAPWLSADAQRLYFLVASASDAPASLWRLDLKAGQKDPILPGVKVLGYDVSPDEAEVVYSIERRGEIQICISPLDHHLAPRLLVRGADQPAFAGNGRVLFRLLGNKVNYLYGIQEDGGSMRRMLELPILQFQSASPTGRWAAVLAVIDGQVSTAILGLGREKFRWVRGGYWSTRWALNGDALYLDVDAAASADEGATLVIPLQGSAAPRIPPLPADNASGILPHGTEGFAPGPHPGTYAFTRTEWLRNIFRIPLHQ